jgi:hypothetical protein
VVTATRKTKHEYLLGIKGYAGGADGIIEVYPWDKIKMSQENYAKGQGREEFRSLKRISLSKLGPPEIFEKYQDMGFAFISIVVCTLGSTKKFLGVFSADPKGVLKR